MENGYKGGVNGRYPTVWQSAQGRVDLIWHGSPPRLAVWTTLTRPRPSQMGQSMLISRVTGSGRSPEAVELTGHVPRRHPSRRPPPQLAHLRSVTEQPRFHEPRFHESSSRKIIFYETTLRSMINTVRTPGTFDLKEITARPLERR